MFGDIRTGFRRMVRIVQSDAQEFANSANAGTDPDGVVNRWQRRRVEAAQPVQRGVVEGGAGDVANMGRQIADRAVCINKAGLFLAGVTITNQFHRISPVAFICTCRCRKVSVVVARHAARANNGFVVGCAVQHHPLGKGTYPFAEDLLPW